MLTMLGLIIGVAAVIVLDAAGQGVKNSVDTAIAMVANKSPSSLSKPQVPDGLRHEQLLTEADAQALRGAPDVALITPQVTGATNNAAGAVNKAVVPQIPVEQASVTGTTANWFQTNNRLLDAGSYFTAAQVSSGTHVAVIGPGPRPRLVRVGH